MDRTKTPAPMRELFVEELAEVRGGTGDPLAKLKEWIREQLLTTYGCGEEGPISC